MPYTLPKLGYSYDALEPFIDSKTMEIHHTKHHQTYIDKVNAVIKNTEFENWDIHELLQSIDIVPIEIKQQVINYGGGHANHELFWKIIGPKNRQEPEGKLKIAISKTFGSFEEFKQKFSDTAKTLFGSGWTWLVVNENNSLEIVATQNQDSPVSDSKTPILLIDVWEHAYYLKYQNKRAEYVDNFWNIVNWQMVEKLYKESIIEEKTESVNENENFEEEIFEEEI